MRGGQETFERFKAIMRFSEAAFTIRGVFSFPAAPRPHFQRFLPPRSKTVHFVSRKSGHANGTSRQKRPGFLNAAPNSLCPL